MRKFSFQMKVQFTAAPCLETFFWGKMGSLLHTWDVRPPTTHDDSAGVTASFIIGPYFFDGTVRGVKCMKCGIMSYQSPATMGLCKKCHFRKIVLQCVSSWLWVWIHKWIINRSVYWLGLCKISFATAMVVL